MRDELAIVLIRQCKTLTWQIEYVPTVHTSCQWRVKIIYKKIVAHAMGDTLGNAVNTAYNQLAKELAEMPL